MGPVVSRLVLALIGLCPVASGLALAVNFRGFPTWYAKTSIERIGWLERPLSRVQPWKSLLQIPLERRVAGQVRLLRVVGAAFAAVGVLVLVASVIGKQVHNS